MKRDIINLNLVTSYPVKWDKYKVFRDLTQNFYDSVSYKEFHDRFHYEYKDGCLILKCTDVSYNYEWLIHIGASTKTNSTDNTAGFFGEGFKIASLCAIRDFNYEIYVSSSNWKINVIENDILIDGSKAKTLAYELELLDEEQNDSTLIIRNVSEEDMETFKCALYSFYYIGNPLIGEEIYSCQDYSVHLRSDVKKPKFYPRTFNAGGEGIIFAAFQARGSIKEPLIYCYHGYQSGDRDREFFSEISNIDIIIRCVVNLSAEASKRILIMYKSLWYRYPNEKFGYKSYYTVVKNLIFRMTDDKEIVKEFNDEYPNILYASKIALSDRKALNERKYCLEWLKHNKEYKLVQDSFKYLDVQSIEDKCKEENVLPKVDAPTYNEEQYINVLNECVKKVFEGFLNIEELPSCMVIRNLKASVSGYASLYVNSFKVYNKHGFLYKYRIDRICIKEEQLKKGSFTKALTTYVHELCHCFGGDKSEVFSYALTDALEILLDNQEIVNEYRRMWGDIR